MQSAESIKHHVDIDVSDPRAPTRDEADQPSTGILPLSLPDAKQVKLAPTDSTGVGNASLYFVGTATTILEWEGIRVMTDPNFLHAGDHVHLGPGVTGTRQTNPAVDLHALPRIDVVLLSHYHADHFDDLVENSLRRDLPIITTPHARQCLTDAKVGGEKFTAVYDLDFFESGLLNIKQAKTSSSRHPTIKVTGMPGKHVPPGPLSVANDILDAVPPTNGWMVELGYSSSSSSSDFQSSYRIYISGDTLFVNELESIPQRYAGQNIDLMLIHLGGTTIPSPKMPLLMVTMDAAQGLKLLQLIKPDITIPIHFDDYDVFLSPLEDFKKAVEEAGLASKVVYLDRGDKFCFRVKG